MSSIKQAGLKTTTKHRQGEARVSAVLSTPYGPFRGRFSARGLVALNFPDASEAEVGMEGDVAAGEGLDVAFWARWTEEALASALDGTPVLDTPPFDLSGSTDFQRAVWKVLQGIPRGTTLTYQEIARALRLPKGARAVGRACGSNPIPVLIPCHRVVGSGGGLGGFSAGIEWKRWLLAREGVH